jgi:hypothetical protein
LTTGTGGNNRPPLRDGFTAYSALSPVNQLVATVAGASITHRRQLGACMGAPGPHDFAVRKCAARLSATHVHRIPRHVRDDRDTPLSSARNGKVKPQLRKKRNRIIFARDS